MITANGIREIIRSVQFNDWQFNIVGLDGDLYLQVQLQADGQHWTGRKWRLSNWMTPSEIVQTALKAVLTAVEHEAREHFLYRGKAIFGPHINVETLWAVCANEEKRNDYSKR